MIKHSRKKIIMRRLAEHITGVRVADGYLYDLEDKVFRGRTQFGEEVQPPFVSILEAPRPIDPNSGGVSTVNRQSRWMLLVQGFAVDDRVNPTDPAYDLAADVEFRLSRIIAIDDQGMPAFPEEFQLGFKDVTLELQETIVRPPDTDISDTAFFYLPVVVQAVTDLRKPYVEL